jgi:putative transposase
MPPYSDMGISPRMPLTAMTLLLSLPMYYGPEFTAKAVRNWLERIGVKTLFIEPGSPWENGYIESFNGKLRDELLNGEIFYTLKEAQVIIERWRTDYNTHRPHSSLGYLPPAPETLEPVRNPQIVPWPEMARLD